jgi:hypothetical protein
MDAQAMDRVHRIGQTKQVTVYRLVCKNTVEERILKRAQYKFTIQKTVYAGGFKLQAPASQPADLSQIFKASELKVRMLPLPYETCASHTHARALVLQELILDESDNVGAGAALTGGQFDTFEAFDEEPAKDAVGAEGAEAGKKRRRGGKKSVGFRMGKAKSGGSRRRGPGLPPGKKSKTAAGAMAAAAAEAGAAAGAEGGAGDHAVKRLKAEA